MTYVMTYIVCKDFAVHSHTEISPCWLHQCILCTEETSSCFWQRPEQVHYLGSWIVSWQGVVSWEQTCLRCRSLGLLWPSPASQTRSRSRSKPPGPRGIYQRKYLKLIYGHLLNWLRAIKEGPIVIQFVKNQQFQFSVENIENFNDFKETISMVLKRSLKIFNGFGGHYHHWMFFGTLTIANGGFSLVFGPPNHLFSMVKGHW